MKKNEKKGRITHDRCTSRGRKFKNGEGRYVRLDQEFCVACYDVAVQRNRG